MRVYVCVSLSLCVVMSFNSVPRRNLLVYPQWRALQYGVGNPVSLSLLSSSADDSLPPALMCSLYVCVIKDKTASRGVCLSVLDWDIVGNEPKQTTALLRAVNVAWIWCKFKIRPLLPLYFKMLWWFNRTFYCVYQNIDWHPLKIYISNVYSTFLYLKHHVQTLWYTNEYYKLNNGRK